MEEQNNKSIGAARIEQLEEKINNTTSKFEEMLSEGKAIPVHEKPIKVETVIPKKIVKTKYDLLKEYADTLKGYNTKHIDAISKFGVMLIKRLEILEKKTKKGKLTPEGYDFWYATTMLDVKNSTNSFNDRFSQSEIDLIELVKTAPSAYNFIREQKEKVLSVINPGFLKDKNYR